MRRAAAAIFALTIIAGCSAAHAADMAVTWDGSSADWTDSAHWGLTPPLYPDNTIDPATSYDAAIAAGTVTLNGLAPVIDSLDLTGGVLAGTGTLTLNNTLNWNGANIGVASVLAKGTINVMPTVNFHAYPTNLIATNFTIDAPATFNLSLSGQQFPDFNFQQHATLTNNGTFNVLSNSNMTGFPNGLTKQGPDGHFINNGILTVQNGFGVSSSIAFDNAGTINVLKGTFSAGAINTSPSSNIDISTGASMVLFNGSVPSGTLQNNGTMIVNPDVATTTLGGAGLHFVNAGALHIDWGTATIGDTPLSPNLTLSPATATASTFVNTGSVTIDSAVVHLYAAQDPATTGAFSVAGTLDFGANYDFSSPAGPTLSGSGLVIVDAGVTLTLPADTAFSGDIQVDGTLLIAPPLDPNAAPSQLSQFTVLPAPEPASLSLFSIGALSLLRRPRRR